MRGHLSSTDINSRSFFERVYRKEPDPFLFETRWYEERKRDVTFSALPDRRYRTAFEPGCATGVHTMELARRCDKVLAVDFAEAGLERARERYAMYSDEPGVGQVCFENLNIPRQWPEGKFDLVLAVEILYYLDSFQLSAFRNSAISSLTDGGILLLTHWADSGETLSQTRDIHEQFASDTRLVSLVSHREQFWVDVYGIGNLEAYRGRPGLFPDVEVKAINRARKPSRPLGEQ